MPNHELQTDTISVYFLEGRPGEFTSIVKADLSPAPSGEQPGNPGAQSIAGVRVARRIIDCYKWWQFFERSVAHSSACGVKARDIVGGGFSVDSRPDGPTVPDTILAEIREALERSLEDLIDACRDWEATGYCALECQPFMDRRKLYKLNHIDSWTLYPALDLSCVVHARDSKYTIFAPLGEFNPQRNQLAWLNNNHWFRNSYYGVPDVVSVLLQIETAWQALKYNLDFFARRGGYKWMLLLSDGPEGAGADAGRDPALIKTINFTTKNVGKDSDTDLVTIPIGSRTATLHKLDADAKDMDFGVLLERYRNEILMAHGVPPIKVGVVEARALGGIAGPEQLRAYRDNVVAPKQQRWERFIESIIKVWWGVDVQFKFNPVEIDEFALLAQPVVQLFQGNIMTRDEARAMIGLDAVDDPNEPVWGYHLGMQAQLTPDAMGAMQTARGEAT